MAILLVGPLVLPGSGLLVQTVMGTVTLIPTDLVAFMLDDSVAWNQLERDEQLLTQQRAEALGLCGPPDYAGERELTNKGAAAAGQLQWVAEQQDNNVMGEL